MIPQAPTGLQRTAGADAAPRSNGSGVKKLSGTVVAGAERAAALGNSDGVGRVGWVRMSDVPNVCASWQQRHKLSLEFDQRHFTSQWLCQAQNNRLETA